MLTRHLARPLHYQRTCLAALTVAMLVIGMLATNQRSLVPTAFAAAPPDTFVSRVVARTNTYRAQFGCPALVVSDKLMRTAQGHSDDMAQHDFFSHTGSDGSSPFQRMRAHGYGYRAAAENVAAGYATPEEVVDGWFNELPPNDGHRQNILNCKLREIGVGYAYLEDDTGTIQFQHYWTQDFGTPR